MTSWECYENKWFYMKYIGKYISILTIIWKLYEEETIFIFAFNAENFMKIR
jgi:hypothetical protein